MAIIWWGVRSEFKRQERHLITIEIWGNLLQLSPIQGLGKLQKELSYTHKSFEKVYDKSSGRTKVSEKMTFDNRKLYIINEDKLVTSTGFLDRVVAYFNKSNTPTQLQDYRKVKNPTIELGNMGVLREGQAEMLAVIAACSNGVLVAPTAFGKSFTIVEICKMYPTLRILIASPAVDVIKTVYARLEREIPKSQLGMFGGGKKQEGRITVTTSASILKVDPDKIDLLLFDEVHTAAGPKISESLGKFTNARMFGFTASPKGRGDGAEKVIEGIFGPVRYTREYQESMEAGNIVPIEVHMYHVSSHGEFYRTALQRKRQGLWTNRRRNTIIASVANSYPEEQTLILVDTFEHLIHLKKLLPDFECVFGKPSAKQLAKFKEQGLIDDDFHVPASKELDDIRIRFEKAELRKAIATGKWAVGVDFVHLGVCIRADGGGSDIKSVQLPGRVARTVDGKDKGILIDFSDEHEKNLSKRSLGRVKVYKDLGWKIIKHGY